MTNHEHHLARASESKKLSEQVIANSQKHIALAERALQDAHTRVPPAADELNESRARVNAAQAEVEPIRAEIQRLRLRLDELESMTDPSSDSLVEESATRRKLEKLAKQETELTASLAEANSAYGKSQRAHADAVNAVTAASLAVQAEKLALTMYENQESFRQLAFDHQRMCLEAKTTTSISRGFWWNQPSVAEFMSSFVGLRRHN